MAGRVEGQVPAIRLFLALPSLEDVDARDKRRHDGGESDSVRPKVALARMSKIAEDRTGSVRSSHLIPMAPGDRITIKYTRLLPGDSFVSFYSNEKAKPEPADVWTYIGRFFTGDPNSDAARRLHLAPDARRAGACGSVAAAAACMVAALRMFRLGACTRPRVRTNDPRDQAVQLEGVRDQAWQGISVSLLPHARRSISRHGSAHFVRLRRVAAAISAAVEARPRNATGLPTLTA